MYPQQEEEKKNVTKIVATFVSASSQGLELSCAKLSSC
jgi:hypothetical protein